MKKKPIIQTKDKNTNRIIVTNINTNNGDNSQKKKKCC